MDEGQRRLLSMYKDISKALNSHHIKFYLGYGTALGAVRHNGFIPWDNDIDLLVWGDDLPAVKKALTEELDPEKYYYHEPMADSHPHVILKEGDFEENLKNKSALFIDIFPLVKYPNKKFRGFLSFVSVWIMHGMITLMDILDSYVFYRCARWTVSAMKRISEAICNADSDEVTVLTTEFHKEICPAKYYGEPVMHQFEDTEAPLPHECDRLLRMSYGNYMELPPEDKRTGAKGYPCCAYFDYLAEKRRRND